MPSWLQRFNTETLVTVLYEARQQMSSRLQQQNLTSISQLALVAPKSVMSDRRINSSDIDIISTTYGVDSGDVVASELLDRTAA